MINYRKNLLCILIVMLNAFSAASQDETNPWVDVFMDIEYTGQKALYDKPGGKIVRLLKHNFEEEDFIVFDLMSKNDSMFYVKAYYAIDGFIAEGWITKDFVGIYSRDCGNPFVLYKQPDKTKGVQCTVKEYNPGAFFVTDYQGKWLKVKAVIEGQLYEGWMSPDMQCPFVYTTCS